MIGRPSELDLVRPYPIHANLALLIHDILGVENLRVIVRFLDLVRSTTAMSSRQADKRDEAMPGSHTGGDTDTFRGATTAEEYDDRQRINIVGVPSVLLARTCEFTWHRLGNMIPPQRHFNLMTRIIRWETHCDISS